MNIVYKNTDAPVIELETYLVYAKVAETLDPLQYIDKVRDRSGRELGVESVNVISYVDFTVPGCGQYKLEVTDAEGRQGMTYLTVIVTE